MPRRNAPESFFSAVRGCPRSYARTNPWFLGRTLPVPGHGGGGGGGTTQHVRGGGSDSPPLLSDWANFSPGLRPINSFLWRLGRKSVEAKTFLRHLRRL